MLQAGRLPNKVDTVSKIIHLGHKKHQPILDGQSCQCLPFVEIRVLSGQLEASTSGSGPFPMWMMF